MPDETKERWYQLCQLATVEKDPEKLLALVSEVNRLLQARDEEKHDRLSATEDLRSSQNFSTDRPRRKRENAPPQE